ncbi:uncharacterized protein LOC144744089 isoform X2 [Ciona intestinalis]
MDDKLPWFIVVMLSYLLVCFSKEVNNCPGNCTCVYVKFRSHIYCHGRRLEIMPNFTQRNVVSLDLSSNYLRMIPVLSLFTKLEDLKLQRNLLKNGTEVLWNHTTRLKSIDLSYNHLETFNFSCNGLPRLKVLRLDHNRIKTISPKAMCIFARLSILTLQSNPFKCSCAFMRLLSDLPTKQSLGTTTSHFNCASDFGLMTADYLSSIQTFDKCQMSTLHFEMTSPWSATVSSLSRLSNLKAKQNLPNHFYKSAFTNDLIDKMLKLKWTPDNTVRSSITEEIEREVIVSCKQTHKVTPSVIGLGVFSITSQHGMKPLDLLISRETNYISVTVDHAWYDHKSVVFICVAETLAGASYKVLILNLDRTQPIVAREADDHFEVHNSKITRYRNEMFHHSEDTEDHSPVVDGFVDVDLRGGRNYTKLAGVPGCGGYVPERIYFPKPINLDPLTYKYDTEDSQVTLTQWAKHRIISVRVEAEHAAEDKIYLCHTHGPWVLHRTIHLDHFHGRILVKVTSLTSDFLICTYFKTARLQVCGNFTVIPSGGPDIKVMGFMVTFLVLFGLIPLLGVVSYGNTDTRITPKRSAQNL